MHWAPGADRLLGLAADLGSLGVARHQGYVVLLGNLALDCLCRRVCQLMAVHTEQQNVVAAVGLHVQREVPPVTGWHHSVSQKVGVVTTSHTPVAMCQNSEVCQADDRIHSSNASDGLLSGWA